METTAEETKGLEHTFAIVWSSLLWPDGPESRSTVCCYIRTCGFSISNVWRMLCEDYFKSTKLAVSYKLFYTVSTFFCLKGSLVIRLNF